jgi:hypothetical protein
MTTLEERTSEILRQFDDAHAIFLFPDLVASEIR